MFLGNTAALNLAHQLIKKKLPHLLITGPSGHGKNTLAYYISKESNIPLIEVNANTIETQKALDRVLKVQNSILLIDEAHGLSRRIQEMLYPTLDRNEISFIFATTREDKINEALKRRVIRIELRPYTKEELFRIAYSLSNQANEKVLAKLVEYSRGIPGKIRTFCQLIEDDPDPYESLYALIKNMELYPMGLTRTEVQLLREVHTPQSLKTLSFKLGIQEEVIVYEHEPYLKKLDFLTTCQQGRVITDKGNDYLTRL